MNLQYKKGFTILELVLFAAIFSITAVSFVTILLATTRIQLRQGSAAEVNSQSQFLLQTLQRYVEQASVIEMPANVATTTLTLRMSSSTYDPTKIYLSGGRIYIQEGSLGAQPITSDKITASNVQFVRKENVGGHDSVSINFTLAYNSANPQNVFTQSLQTSVARVSAATFDSNVIPNTGNTWKLGASAGDWQSINNTIFFNGANVGIGVSNPGTAFAVSGSSTFLGGVSIGTTTVAAQLYVDSDLTVLPAITARANNSTGGTLLRFYTTSTVVGSITVSGSGTTFNTTSDYRLKQNIRDSSLGLSTLMEIKVRDYEFISDPVHSTQGFIAQELAEIYPQAVTRGGEDPAKNPWLVDYGKLTPLLVKSVQELGLKVKNLASEARNIVAGNVEALRIRAKNVFAENGVTTKDAATGEAYCMRVNRGSVEALPGECP